MSKFEMVYEMAKTFSKDDDTARRLAWRFKEKKTVPLITCLYNLFCNADISLVDLEQVIRMKKKLFSIRMDNMSETA